MAGAFERAAAVGIKVLGVGNVTDCYGVRVDAASFDRAVERLEIAERVVEAARAGRATYGHNHNGDFGYSVPCADRSTCYVARLDDALTDFDKVTEKQLSRPLAEQEGK